MRDHVLLQAIARVNRPYVDGDGFRKRVGLIVDFVGVLRDLRQALRFDSSDVGGVIEDLDLLQADFLERIERAKAEYLDDTGAGGADERLEAVVYGRFIDPEARRAFFDAFKELEALWEILSPSPALRDHLETWRRLARLCAAVRNAYRDRDSYPATLGRKTASLVQERTIQADLGRFTRTVDFDAATLDALRGEPGSDEAKVFNLVRGLRREVAEAPGTASVLRPLQERADRVLADLETRRITGLAALDLLSALVGEKARAGTAAAESGLSPTAFGVYWALKDDAALRAAGVSARSLAREAEALRTRFPNAADNADERRRLRAALYQPLLEVARDDRGRIVDSVLAILIGADADADA